MNYDTYHYYNNKAHRNLHLNFVLKIYFLLYKKPMGISNKELIKMSHLTKKKKKKIHSEVIKQLRHII